MEKIIAAVAPTGIGLMYGPINPCTKAIGMMEAMTAKVARIVGIAHFIHRLDRDIASGDFPDSPAADNGARCSPR